jgi:ribosomal protein S18 acetylase RimI-like enzyme
MSNKSTISIRVADYNDEQDAQAVFEVLNAYAQDPMGLEHPLDPNKKEAIIEGLNALPTAFSVLAFDGEDAVGLANCIIGFSTFSACRLINIHDLAVMPGQRGKGIGQQLLDFIVEEAGRRDCCKITLEVRRDNPARRLYERNGFEPDEPPFDFWTKQL